MEINERQTEVSTISLKINTSTDVFQQFYYDCKLSPTIFRDGSRDFEKVERSISATGWMTKKMLSFRWPKKAKITLETKAFGEMFLSVFSNFFHFYI